MYMYQYQGTNLAEQFNFLGFYYLNIILLHHDKHDYVQWIIFSKKACLFFIPLSLIYKLITTKTNSYKAKWVRLGLLSYRFTRSKPEITFPNTRPTLRYSFISKTIWSSFKLKPCTWTPKMMIDSLTGWLINQGWLTNQTRKRVSDWLIDWLIDWLTDQPICLKSCLQIFDWLTNWLTDWLTDWKTDRQTD